MQHCEILVCLGKYLVTITEINTLDNKYLLTPGKFIPQTILADSMWVEVKKWLKQNNIKQQLISCIDKKELQLQ